MCQQFPRNLLVQAFPVRLQMPQSIDWLVDLEVWRVCWRALAINHTVGGCEIQIAPPKKPWFLMIQSLPCKYQQML